MKRNIVFAVGLMVAMAAWAAAQYGGGGYQGFTVPSLIVDPGDVSIAGDLQIDGTCTGCTAADVLLADTTNALTAQTKFDLTSGNNFNSVNINLDETIITSTNTSTGETFSVNASMDSNYVRLYGIQSTGNPGSDLRVGPGYLTWDTVNPSDTDFSLNFNDDFGPGPYLSISQVGIPAKQINFSHSIDSDPEHTITTTNGTGNAVQTVALGPAGDGYHRFTSSDGTKANFLRLDSDGSGLEWDMTSPTITDVDFDLSDVLDDVWLTFTDVATPTNLVTYQQTVNSDPGLLHSTTNGTDITDHQMVAATNASFSKIRAVAAVGNAHHTIGSQYGGYLENSVDNTQQRKFIGVDSFTDNVAKGLLALNLSNGSAVGGSLHYTAFSSSGGAIMTNTGIAAFACLNEADAEVCTVTMQAAEAAAVDGDSGATMACTLSTANGTNQVTLQITCDTSNAASGLVYWNVETLNDYIQTVAYQ